MKAQTDARAQKNKKPSAHAPKPTQSKKVVATSKTKRAPATKFASANGRDNKNPKLTLKADALKNALNAIKPALGKGSTLPVLSHIALDAQPHGITRLMATNLEIALWRYVDAKTPRVGRATLPPLTIALANNLQGDETVTLDVNATPNAATLTLNAGNVSTELKTLDPDEFPIIAAPPADQTSAFALLFTRDQLVEIIKRVMPFVADDQARPILTGVHLSGKLPTKSGDAITLTADAADGFRLAQLTLRDVAVEWKTKTKLETFSATVPPRIFSEALKLLDAMESDKKSDRSQSAEPLIPIEFHLYLAKPKNETKKPSKPVKPSTHGEGIARVQTTLGGVQMLLLHGDYPDIGTVTQEPKTVSEIPLPVAETMNALAVSELFNQGVRLQCDMAKKALHLTATSADLGKFEETLSIGYDDHAPADQYQFGVNAEWLADMLRACAINEEDAKPPRLRVSNHGAPMFMRSKNYRHVLMPMDIGALRKTEPKPDATPTNSPAAALAETPAQAEIK